MNFETISKNMYPNKRDERVQMQNVQYSKLNGSVISR